jgi:hypothetical protein
VRRLLILRGIFAVLVGALAVVALVNGEEVFGALLAGLAVTNVILLTIFTWHRVTLVRRPRGLAARPPR